VFQIHVDFWNKVVTRSDSDPQDWLVLAMRETTPMFFSGGVNGYVLQGPASLWALKHTLAGWLAGW
jgi:hypothetical protein